jgi:hypothetical protein
MVSPWESGRVLNAEDNAAPKTEMAEIVNGKKPELREVPPPKKAEKSKKAKKEKAKVVAEGGSSSEAKAPQGNCAKKVRSPKTSTPLDPPPLEAKKALPKGNGKPPAKGKKAKNNESGGAAKAPAPKPGPKTSQVTDFHRRMMEEGWLILQQCCSSDAAPSKRQVISGWASEGAEGSARPSILELADWNGRTHAAKFADDAAKEMAEGCQFPNPAAEGHTVRWVHSCPPVSKIYKIEGVSLCTESEVTAALTGLFKRDNFRLYREVVGAIRLDTYVVEFLGIPSCVYKKVAIPAGGGKLWEAKLSKAAAACSSCDGGKTHLPSSCPGLVPLTAPAEANE